MKTYEPLTDLQWQLVESYFRAPPKRSRGKPHTPWRGVLNAILFVLTTGEKWGCLPKNDCFASKSAAHRWYKEWKANGFLDHILMKLSEFSAMGSSIKFPSTRNRGPKVVPTLQTA